MDETNEYWNAFFEGMRSIRKIKEMSDQDFNKFVNSFLQGEFHTVSITEDEIKNINKEFINDNN